MAVCGGAHSHTYAQADPSSPKVVGTENSCWCGRPASRHRISHANAALLLRSTCQPENPPTATRVKVLGKIHIGGRKSPKNFRPDWESNPQPLEQPCIQRQAPSQLSDGPIFVNSNYYRITLGFKGFCSRSPIRL